MTRLLDFETSLQRIEDEINQLRSNEAGDDSSTLARINKLDKERNTAVKKIYNKLSDWQTCLVARHPERPQTNDYISELLSDFSELHGDRCFADDRAIIAGLATFRGRPVAVIGHQKGKGTEARIHRNFGMAGPEGYRKALRVMELAEKFRLPLITFVDTPGAYPGIGAEERGQSGAIGQCLVRAASLRTPMLALVIGEGGSGGALAIAVGDYVGMLRHSIYSVISPEGCASILWKDGTRSEDAANLLGLTAPQLKKLRLIDDIIDEPPGGAHRHPKDTAEAVGNAMDAALGKLDNLEIETLLEQRHRRWRNYGKFEELRT